MNPITKIINQVKAWHKERRYTRARAVMIEFGLTPVHLIERAGSTYIVGPNGAMYRIGRAEKSAIATHRGKKA